MSRYRHSEPFYLTPEQRTIALALIDCRPQQEMWIDWKTRVVQAAKELKIERRGYFYAIVCGRASGLADRSAENFAELFEVNVNQRS